MLLLHRFTKCLQIVEQQILLQKENSLKRCTETTWAKSHGWNCAVKKVTLLGSTLTLRWCAAKLVSVFFHFCSCSCVLQFTLSLCTVAPFWTAKFFYSNWATLHLCLFVCVRAFHRSCWSASCLDSLDLACRTTSMTSLVLSSLFGKFLFCFNIIRLLQLDSWCIS